MQPLQLESGDDNNDNATRTKRSFSHLPKTRLGVFCVLSLLASVVVVTPLTFARQFRTWLQPNNNNNNNNINMPTKQTSGDDEPNPPAWPSSVLLFHPNDTAAFIRESILPTQDPLYPKQDSNEEDDYISEAHFSSRRHVLLFAPGTYHDVSFQVGYYIQVAGLGRHSTDVTFTANTTTTTAASTSTADNNKKKKRVMGPFCPALNKHLHGGFGTSLDTFWRAVENVAVAGNFDLFWAVSQAAPLRKVTVTGGGDLVLFDGGAYASGGHLANATVTGGGKVRLGGQQQFLLRHVGVGQGVVGGAWSRVLAGCTADDAPPVPFPGNATLASTTVIPKLRKLEKPYLAVQKPSTTATTATTNKTNLKFDLIVPQLEYSDDGTGDVPEDERPLERVRVVSNHTRDASADIQHALDEGKDVILAPGIFTLTRTIVLRHDNQVMLGLGLATLAAPTDGSPCVKVAPHVGGVRIAGIMLEASERAGTSAVVHSSLLEWGEEGKKDPGDAANPGGLFDIFCRVGGAVAGDRTRIHVDSMMRLHSGHILGDNLWLWRADHGVLAKGEEANYPNISPLYWQSESNEFRVETGIIVNGDDIEIAGLAVEHANGHQVIWKGERGRVYFYQCEFPYGVGHEFSKGNYRGYVIDPSVNDHHLHAPGIYSNFRNANVLVETAIEAPDKPNVHVRHPFTVKLDNQGGILSILNGKGPPATGEKGLPARLESPNGSM